MYLPEYRDHSIVNLMSAILKAYGNNSIYKPLRNLDVDALRRSTNLVLLVIDGLGHEFFIQHVKKGILARLPCEKITSVFPPTTATAVTTFATGLAPQQHAITGWFMYLKELGSVVKILPFVPRHGCSAQGFTGDYMQRILGCEPISSKLNVGSYFLYPHFLHGSAYRIATSRGAETIAYESLSDCLSKIAEVVKSNRRKKFMYAYWSELDTICHSYGTRSPEAIKHFMELEQNINKLIRELRNSNTTVLITSDHGLIDTDAEDFINLNLHPELAATLTLPLCGEPRVAYCYVRPSRIRRFREYVSAKLSPYCTLYRSQDLIKKNFFGLQEPNEKLLDRVGDYILIMKGNYVVKDFIMGETTHILKANHGGVSKEEMYVPLVEITC
ncbi:MAG: alkaline phosphatase family protein [candidate division WOR-3 bacterium]|nr:MAG: alkaline phosphatase family protein [candidate division WOR-3 bacterium]